jgi:XTP/dITP diphosphohydrolase
LATAGIVAHVLADDSGLEVAALDGRPGVTTAYYGGAALTWQQRRAALLHELSACSSDERAARFVCALHFIAANGAELATFATVDGTIAYADAGTAGFSFDPIFVYPPAGRTFAELTEAQKNAVSHRAVALAALTAGIVARGIADPPAQ